MARPAWPERSRFSAIIAANPLASSVTGGYPAKETPLIGKVRFDAGFGLDSLHVDSHTIAAVDVYAIGVALFIRSMTAGRQRGDAPASGRFAF